MDQRELAVALDKSPSVISALVNNVTGKAAAGKKLKRQALDYLHRRIHASESVIKGRSESAQPGVAGFQDRRETEPLETWRQRAIIAEERLKQIAGIATAPISSTGDLVYRVVKKSVAGSNENAPTPKSE